MFENKWEPLATRRVFLARVINSFLATLVVIAVSLGFGAWGYHVFGRLAWIDALLNAAMILTGMGPVDAMNTSDGKLFATFYCLFSGYGLACRPDWRRSRDSRSMIQRRKLVEPGQGQNHLLSVAAEFWVIVSGSRRFQNWI